MYFEIFAYEEGLSYEKIDLSVPLAIMGMSYIIMAVLGGVLVMPIKMKNKVRRTPQYKKMKKSVKKAVLRMRVCHALLYPVLFILLFLLFMYIYAYGLLHSEAAVISALKYYSLVLVLDWVVVEFIVNVLFSIFVACGHTSRSCMGIAVLTDCLKGYRNASF